MKWSRVLASLIRTRRLSLAALALLFLPLVASAAQDRTHRAPERNVTPPERPHVLELLAAPNENSRQGLNEEFGPLRLARFLIKPESHSAFDRSSPNLSPGSTEYGFTGRENDNESGLMHYRARSYDPMTGRFTSRDPVGFSNRYIYTHNDPVNRTDPSGLYDPKGLFEEFAKKDKDGQGRARLAKLLRAGYKFVEEDDGWDDVEIDPEKKTISLDPDLYDYEGADYLLKRLKQAEPGVIGGFLQGAFGATGGGSLKRAEGGIEFGGEAILPGFENFYVTAMVDAAAIGNQAEHAIIREAALFALAYVGGKALGAVFEELEASRGLQRRLLDPDNIALGLKEEGGLWQAAQKGNAARIEVWKKIGLVDKEVGNFPAAFQQAADRVVAKGGRLKFSLKGYDVGRGLKASANPLDVFEGPNAGNIYTDWEFAVIRRNRDWFDATDFIDAAGRVLSREEAGQLGITFVK